MRRTWLLLGVLVLAGCGSSAAERPISGPPAKAGPYKGTAIPARPAPALTLHDASGRVFTLAGRRGYTLVTFIYTHCPDVCPLIASNLNTGLRQIGARTHHVSVLAVSVDPQGDTPAAVRAYEKRMHLLPQFHYLIGTRSALRRVWSAWHVAAVARSADLVDHVAYTALIDPAGRERVLYDAQVRAADVVHDLRVLMRTTP